MSWIYISSSTISHLCHHNGKPCDLYTACLTLKKNERGAVKRFLKNVYAPTEQELKARIDALEPYRPISAAQLKELNADRANLREGEL